MMCIMVVGMSSMRMGDAVLRNPDIECRATR